MTCCFWISINWLQFFLLTAVFELPVVPQSCRRTVELIWSLRRSSAARARPWSARVTVVTPPCTSAGIATPACPWWTLVLLWRYQTACLSSSVCLHTSHICCPLQPCSCGRGSGVCSALCCLSWSSSPQAKDHWFNVLCLTFLMFVFLSFSLFRTFIFTSSTLSLSSLSCIYLFVLFHLCPSTLTLLEASSLASELTRPLSSLQGPVPLSVVCWYTTRSLSFSDTCWSREVLQTHKCIDLHREILQKLHDEAWSIYIYFWYGKCLCPGFAWVQWHIFLSCVPPSFLTLQVFVTVFSLNLSLSCFLCAQNQLSGNLLRKFKNSNGWQKLWVVFTNFSLFFYKSHQVRFQVGGWGFYSLCCSNVLIAER